MNPTPQSAENTPSQPASGFAGRLDRYFRVHERGSTFPREIRGGLATFFAMAYIIVLNPLIIGTAEDMNGDTLGLAPVAATTALVGGVVSILMGAISRYPFAIAAGMGLNVIVAYTLAPQMTWADAMGVIVLEGLVLLVLVLTGFRTAVFRAIPPELKTAIAVGVGLFLALVGFVNAGFIRRIPDAANTTVPVQLGSGSLSGWPILVFVIGLVLTIVLIVRNVRGAMLIGIVVATVVGVVVEALAGIGPMSDGQGNTNPDGWSLTVPQLPTSPGDLVAVPDFSLVGQFSLFGSFAHAGTIAVILLVFTLLLADFFDTMGTMVGVAGQARLLDEEGNVPHAREVLIVDSLGTIAGGAASASSNTVFAESAAGVGEGARTGIAPIVTGLLFLVATLFSPLVELVPFEAATPVLIIVGFMMMTQVTKIPFQNYAIGIPAFLTIVVMPFSYSITNGIGVGFISYVVIRTAQGRLRDVHPLLWVVSAAFVVHFALGPIESLLGL
ncbi:NCS2 family permease [Streptomonospora nanhaiensis]|uniref:AGZA family xanthine/uracil permease-like MFS transporter n=1 Tax=Streptomonospora nanhaiensis TaxID=1323731 RepID=A0A853BMQ8_9ACTN|nr:NCS2 family permease [Streptomonospora nanhaiensis]MBV2363933.1 NCS2 family permease [Streptomonospora nanhaiensis]MBX9388399.1 NCS2 family permease [Streptomonospora nanhaiensis]NYI96758.1 AGZA family xanthine/uracil permease-like MFS transporter [Streptomonospora nanhaiensis]